jgi:hypothetical protein
MPLNPTVHCAPSAAVRASSCDVEPVAYENPDIVASIPVSAAVTFLGRVLHPAGRPSFLVYDRSDNGYQPALEVGSR